MMSLLGKRDLSENNYNNVISIECGEHNFITKACLNKF